MSDILQDGWLYERSFFSKFSMGWKVKKVLHTEQSKYQRIDVVETESVGKLLLLDGKTMVSDKDEYVYHEVMAHIPWMVSRSCKKVLIIGGGDGGVVREFARHKEIQQIDLVEIDERVIEVSKKFFPGCTSALGDPRVKVIAKDGLAYIKSKRNEYDVIIVDSTDPEDFASGLFTSEFYNDIYTALTSEGIMMNQTENPFFDEYGIKNIYTNMKKAFPHVASFSAPMSIYPGVYWTFGFSSKAWGPKDLNPSKKQEMAAIEPKLKWYNMDWHLGAFNVGTFHKKMTGLT